MITQTQTQDHTTSTTSPQEERPDAAAQWREVISKLQAFQARCEHLDGVLAQTQVELGGALDQESVERDG